MRNVADGRARLNVTASSSAISTTANTMRVAQKSGMKKSSTYGVETLSGADAPRLGGLGLRWLGGAKAEAGAAGRSQSHHVLTSAAAWLGLRRSHSSLRYSRSPFGERLDTGGAIANSSSGARARSCNSSRAAPRAAPASDAASACDPCVRICCAAAPRTLRRAAALPGRGARRGPRTGDGNLDRLRVVALRPVAVAHGAVGCRRAIHLRADRAAVRWSESSSKAQRSDSHVDCLRLRREVHGESNK